MNNKFSLFLYIIIIIIGFFVNYNFYQSNNIITDQKIIRTLDPTVFQMYKKQFDLNKSFGYIWNIKDSISKKETEQNTFQKIEVKQKNHQICIRKKCYKFIAIYSKGKQYFITFYSKNFKKGIKNFTESDEITDSIFVSKISKNKISLAEKNSARKWEFTLFDVNITKYRPKDINETVF